MSNIHDQKPVTKNDIEQVRNDLTQAENRITGLMQGVKMETLLLVVTLFFINTLILLIRLHAH